MLDENGPDAGVSMCRRGLDEPDQFAGDGAAAQDAAHDQLKKKAKRENAALIWEQLNKKTVPKAGTNRNFAVASFCREVRGKTDPDKVVFSGILTVQAPFLFMSF